jgi:hypothetical protein
MQTGAMATATIIRTVTAIVTVPQIQAHLLPEAIRIRATAAAAAARVHRLPVAVTAAAPLRQEEATVADRLPLVLPAAVRILLPRREDVTQVAVEAKAAVEAAGRPLKGWR